MSRLPPIVALALLLLATPVLAQEGDEETQAQDASSEPQTGEQSTSAPDASPEPESQQAAADEPESCPLMANHILDERVPKSQWVIIDPNGCVRRTVEGIIQRILERPTSLLPF